MEDTAANDSSSISLNLTKETSVSRALGARCSPDVISITFESSATIVSSRAVLASGARVVTKCDGMGRLVVLCCWNGEGVGEG